MLNNYKIVDLFCGCGGFGLGAKQAGFEVIVAIDIDDTLRSAYKTNFPQTRVMNGDLSKMDQASWSMLLGKESVDGVIGGPPCQGYSRMGKGDINDPRRSLLYHFFRTVNIIQPKFFVMENVEGLLDNGNVQELEQAMGTADPRYKILDPIILDASEFGAPTKRKRVVVIGFDQKQISELSIADIVACKKPLVTVKDAISDISEPVAQDSSPDNMGWSGYRAETNLSSYAKKMRAIPLQGMGCPIAIKKLMAGFTSGHFETIHSEDVKNRYSKVLPGNVDKISRAKKLSWNGLCPTLRAGTGSDKGSHQAVRPLHPDSARVITVREAARLQGFPDWFSFHKAKWHSFRMIGNSVSPLVSESILTLISQKLAQNSSKKKANRQ